MPSVKPDPTIPAEVLDLLACPACYQSLTLVTEASAENQICCTSCGRRYPIEDGIPILLSDRASPPLRYRP